MNILKILNELAADNSRLAKEAILKHEKDNELLKGVFFHALNPYINFYQKKIPEYIPNNTQICLPLSTAINALKELSTRKVTGNKAIARLVEILESVNPDNAQVIERIIARDLKCGVNEATVNKIWPGLIPTFNVMLAHKDISGIQYPAFAQTKMDGARCHLYFDGTKATAFARSGKVFELHGSLDTDVAKILKAGETLDGELLFTDKNGKLLDRKTSNGLANKANKGTISEKEASRAVFVTWDIVDFTSKIIYKDRWNDLESRIHSVIGKQSTVPHKIRLVNSKIVMSEEEAEQFFEKQLEAGEEGAILKNLKGVWVPKRSKDLGKMKAEEEADLIVVNFKFGNGKYEGLLGSLECETSDGKINVNVSGMPEDVRFSRNPEEWIGTIITVRYNAIIDKKNDNKKSLFLPRFVEERFDKKQANKIEELK